MHKYQRYEREVIRNNIRNISKQMIVSVKCLSRSTKISKMLELLEFRADEQRRRLQHEEYHN